MTNTPYGPHIIEIRDTNQFCDIALNQDYWAFMYARFVYLMESCFPGSLENTP
jgi:hypothetical protein